MILTQVQLLDGSTVPQALHATEPVIPYLTPLLTQINDQQIGQHGQGVNVLYFFVFYLPYHAYLTTDIEHAQHAHPIQQCALG